MTRSTTTPRKLPAVVCIRSEASPSPASPKPSGPRLLLRKAVKRRIVSTIGTLPEVGYVRQAQLVPHILPFSQATLWRKVKAGKFPKPVTLSERVIAWRVEDVRGWMAEIDGGQQ